MTNDRKTAPYRCPSAPAPITPPAEECDRDLLLRIAYHAATSDSWWLAGSRDHIEAVCTLAVDLAQEVADVTERMTAETAERVRLQDLAVRLAQENAVLRDQLLALSVDLDDRARRAALRDRRDRRDRREMSWDESDLALGTGETDVVDIEELDEPTAARVMTTRDVVVPSEVIIYGHGGGR